MARTGMKELFVFLGAGLILASAVVLWPGERGEAQIPLDGMGSEEHGEANKPQIQLEEAQEILRDIPGLNVRYVGGMVVMDGTVKGQDNQSRLDKVKEAYGNVLNLVNYAEPVEIYGPLANEIKGKIPFPDVSLNIVKGGRLILSGTVSSPGSKQDAENIAKAYYPSEKVVNTIQVLQQVVEVDVLFAAVDLTRLRQTGTGLFRELGFTGVGHVSYSQQGSKKTVTAASGEKTEEGVPSGKNYGWEVNGNINATLRLLRDNGYIRILTQPHLSTISGETATFQSGGTRGFRVAGTGSASVEYKDYGVMMSVRPDVMAHDRIRTRVELEVSKPVLVNESTIDFTTYRTTSEAILTAQQTLVASGLVETIKNEFENKVPLLGDIPIINFFFSDRGERYEDRELVVFITPYLPTLLDEGRLGTEGYGQGSSQWRESLRRADPVLDEEH